MKSQDIHKKNNSGKPDSYNIILARPGESLVNETLQLQMVQAITTEVKPSLGPHHHRFLTAHLEEPEQSTVALKTVN